MEYQVLNINEIYNAHLFSKSEVVILVAYFDYSRFDFDNRFVEIVCDVQLLTQILSFSNHPGAIELILTLLKMAEDIGEANIDFKNLKIDITIEDQIYITGLNIDLICEKINESDQLGREYARYKLIDFIHSDQIQKQDFDLSNTQEIMKNLDPIIELFNKVKALENKGLEYHRLMRAYKINNSYVEFLILSFLKKSTTI